MRGIRVLVTRPEPGASRTAARLERLGATAIVIPLTRIVRLDVNLDALPADFGAVAATSVNALRHAPASLLDRLNSLPAFAVGPQTAEAFAEAGFPDIEEAEGDGIGLAKALLKRSMRNRPLAYLCGRLRTPDFERRLLAGGAIAQPIETYDTCPIDYPGEALRELTGGAVDAALLYSSVAAELLGGLAIRPENVAAFAGARYLCLSKNIGSALPPALHAQVEIATNPTEDTLFAML